MKSLKKLSELVAFRNNLFFGGAVQVSWFEKDHERRDLAARNFVFHGPQYHGVLQDDFETANSYSLIDTAGFIREVCRSLDTSHDGELPIALAIAGYGTGKSHLGLTLATFLSDPISDIGKEVLANIQSADSDMAAEIYSMVKNWGRPFLVLAINGMENIDLANELSRQVLVQLRLRGLDTGPVEDLWPRFEIASKFVELNFDIHRKQFLKLFGKDADLEEILLRLRDHDDLAYQNVNEIYRLVNGEPLRVAGQESPQQLIETVCDSYCGPEGPFEGLLIVFDEFGRYVEFAAEKPHVAGDAALQQLFEGVQHSARRCFLLCFIQYELKVYLARVSNEKQTTVSRYITRYDSSKKYYLSTNLETLFANLIEKKEPAGIRSQVALGDRPGQWTALAASINRWLPSSKRFSIWRDPALFRKVAVEGCWPLHPLATWFLTRLGNLLQSRSAITFVREVLEKEADRKLSDELWTIPATDLCNSALIQELLASEEYGLAGATAQAYVEVEQKYRNDLSVRERATLLSVLVSGKMGLRVENKDEALSALALLSGASVGEIDKALKSLTDDYGVVEWNDRFNRFELIADAVPRSAFLAFLKKKTREISDRQKEDLFAAHANSLADLEDFDPDFATEKKISTSEWRFKSTCVHLPGLRQGVVNAINNWREAYQIDSFRGQVLYCYTGPDHVIEDVTALVSRIFGESLEKEDSGDLIPLFIVLMHDEDGRLGELLANDYALSELCTEEERSKFSNFIDQHRLTLKEEIKNTSDKMCQRRYFVLPPKFKTKSTRIRAIAKDLFAQTYLGIIPFDFDGFRTARGNAAKDCREIAVELFKGTLNYEFIATRPQVLQNRAVKLLTDGAFSWGVLSEDGQPSRYPTHVGLRKVISHLDRTLKKETALNLGSVFRYLVEPPYGFNIASAALVIGAFVAARKDSIAFLKDGSEISATQWLGESFSGNYLKVELLYRTEIRHVSGEEADEWKDLLDRWDAEESHAGRIACLRESESLKERVHLPAGALFEKCKRLRTETEESCKALDEFEKFLGKQNAFYERAVKLRDVGSLMQTGKSLVSRLKSMLLEKGKWNSNEVDVVAKNIETTRQLVIQYFDAWLPNETCLSAKALGAFTNRMESYCQYLKALNLPDLVKQAEAQQRRVVEQIEESQKLSYCVEESKAFLESRVISGQTRVADLATWRDEAAAHVKTLQTARQKKRSAEMDQLIQDLGRFREDCGRQLEIHKDRLSALFEKQFLEAQDVLLAQSEVKELCELFAGRDADLDDLIKMNLQLGELSNDLTQWKDLSITNEELDLIVKKRMQEIAERGEDLPLDSDKIYQSLLKTLVEERAKMANEWVERISTALREPEKLSAEECHSLLKRTEAIPAYCSETHRKKINAARAHLEKRLDNLELEGLMVRFRKLSKELQHEFLRLVGLEGTPQAH